jgi:hypothetical protein
LQTIGIDTRPAASWVYLVVILPSSSEIQLESAAGAAGADAAALVVMVVRIVMVLVVQTHFGLEYRAVSTAASVVVHPRIRQIRR